MSERPELCEACAADEQPDIDVCSDKVCCCVQRSIWDAGYARAMAEVRAILSALHLDADADGMREHYYTDGGGNHADRMAAAVVRLLKLTEPRP